MKALNFLNVDSHLKKAAQFSGLAGQKLSMMPKTLPQKKSVVAEGIKGAMGGAMAGASLAANMGAFDKAVPTSAPGTGATAEASGGAETASGGGGAVDQMNPVKMPLQNGPGEIPGDKPLTTTGLWNNIFIGA